MLYFRNESFRKNWKVKLSAKSFTKRRVRMYQWNSDFVFFVFLDRLRTIQKWSCGECNLSQRAEKKRVMKPPLFSCSRHRNSLKTVARKRVQVYRDIPRFSSLQLLGKKKYPKKLNNSLLQHLHASWREC